MPTEGQPTSIPDSVFLPAIPSEVQTTSTPDTPRPNIGKRILSKLKGWLSLKKTDLQGRWN